MATPRRAVPSRPPDPAAACEGGKLMTPIIRPLAVSLALSLGMAAAGAEEVDRQQMKGLDEQVQDIKTDVLGSAAELNLLEEKLLYPSGTQVAVFVALAQGDKVRLDAVQIQIDGELVAHYIYRFMDLEARRKGGVQLVYVGNLPPGTHTLGVSVFAKLKGEPAFSTTSHFFWGKV